MLVPAALEQWAIEHNEQLSEDTVREVRGIADTLAGSSLSGRTIDDPGEDFAARLRAIFPPARAERAATLVPIVAGWAAKREPESATAAGEVAIESTRVGTASLDTATESPDRRGPVFEQPRPPDPNYGDNSVESPPFLHSDNVDEKDDDQVEAPAFLHNDNVAEKDEAPAFLHSDRVDEKDDDQVEAPAFLRSDRVDEEDDVRIYGPKRRWKAFLGLVLTLGLVAAAVAAGWYWFDQRQQTDDQSSSPDPVVTAAPAPDETENDLAPTAEPEREPTPVPTPTPELPAFFADTTPILNSGSSQVMASTYAVSPANRAVLTGHTAAITGLAVTNDGRVITSGADRRLVDWGSDVTLANPDVLNVPSPLTVLERTVDQRILAGDADGNLTIIDLVNTTEAIVLPVHDVAISAATELADGRFAVASADGEVAIFAANAASERTVLEHSVEVTAVAGLANGTIVTAAVDGILRLWPASGEGEPGEIATLQSPVTALTVLDDGRLATASVDGAIHVVPATSGTIEVTELPGHVGAVRTLFEIELPDGAAALASGGDDTTIRLWNLDTQSQLQVLEGHGDIISGLDALPDGRLVSTSGDGTGRVWDLTVPPSRPVIPPHNWNLSAIGAWDNDQFVTGGTDGRIMLASTAETSEPLLISQHDAPIVGITVLQSGDIASLDASSVLRVNQASGDSEGLVEFQIAPGATALDLWPSAGIVTGHADGTVRFHDLFEEVLAVESHGSGVNDVVALTNGLVASAGQDTNVRIIDPENPDASPVFDLHTAPVDVVIELPDGRIASAGSDGIYLFSVDGLAQDHVRLNGQRARTISLVALPGDRLISSGDDGRVRLWDLTTPEAEPVTLIDIPGVINPHLIEADNGLFVAGAARGYVVFTLS